MHPCMCKHVHVLARVHMCARQPTNAPAHMHVFVTWANTCQQEDGNVHTCMHGRAQTFVCANEKFTPTHENEHGHVHCFCQTTCVLTHAQMCLANIKYTRTLACFCFVNFVTRVNMKMLTSPHASMAQTCLCACVNTRTCTSMYTYVSGR